MEDDLHTRTGLDARRRIGQVAFDKLHGLKASQIGPLAGDETVDAANRFAALEQFRGDRPADEARNSRNQIFCQTKAPMKLNFKSGLCPHH